MMEAVYSFLIGLVSMIYWFAGKAFEIFSLLANNTVFEHDQYGKLITNMYVIIGVVMLFVIAFSLLKSMIDPEGKESGTEAVTKIIGKFITSLIILVFLPTIFNFAFQFQNAVLTQGSIGRLFGNNSTLSNSDGSKDVITEQSSVMINSVFTAFFYPNMESDACSTSSTMAECRALITPTGEYAAGKSLEGSVNYVNMSGEISSEYKNYAKNIDDNEITFNWFLALIAGIAVAYVIVSFCFDLGIRVVKLVFYQIIAPIPLFLRVIPNGKMSESFGTWIKITSTCYFEVFVRLFAVYLGIFMFSIIPNASEFVNEGSAGEIVGILANAFVVMGIIVFIKELPKLLGEVIGIDSSNMKLGIREKLAAGGALMAGAAVGSSATMLARNAVQSGKNIKNATGVRGKAKAAGAGLWSTAAGSLRGGYHGLKAGTGAKSFTDMKNAAGKGASTVGEKQQSEEAYRAAHGGSWLSSKLSHAKDTIDTIPQWAGITDLDSSEADRYTEAANAIDAAHSLLEGIYKGKPDHDNLKQAKSAANTALRNIMLNSKDNAGFAKLSSISDEELRSGNFSVENATAISEALGHTATAADIKLIQDYKAANSQLEIHEYSQMEKKASIAATAMSNLVEAKLKFGDIGDVFDETALNKLHTAGESSDDKAFVDSLIKKIQEGKAIQKDDLILYNEDGSVKNTINFNNLESVTDKLGIYAKELAGAKQNELRVAKATASSGKTSDSGNSK